MEYFFTNYAEIDVKNVEFERLNRCVLSIKHKELYAVVPIDQNKYFDCYEISKGGYKSLICRFYNLLDELKEYLKTASLIWLNGCLKKVNESMPQRIDIEEAELKKPNIDTLKKIAIKTICVGNGLTKQVPSEIHNGFYMIRSITGKVYLYLFYYDEIQTVFGGDELEKVVYQCGSAYSNQRMVECDYEQKFNNFLDQVKTEFFKLADASYIKQHIFLADEEDETNWIYECFEKAKNKVYAQYEK